MEVDLTENEIMVIYTLLNDHLNTIGNIGAHYIRTSPIQGQNGDYVWCLEKLEDKIMKVMAQS